MFLGKFLSSLCDAAGHIVLLHGPLPPGSALAMNGYIWSAVLSVHRPKEEHYITL